MLKILGFDKSAEIHTYQKSTTIAHISSKIMFEVNALESGPEFNAYQIYSLVELKPCFSM